jgi:hypothetical protein
MPDALIAVKKSAVGANSITLALDPAAGGPPTLNATLVNVVFTFSGPPPASIWGVLNDGRACDLHIRERS